MADDDWAPAAPSALAEATGTASQRAPDVEVPGYTDLREIARGGDSIVYRARQPSVDREVAIKVIQVTDPADVARFRRELEITVRLGRQHPHIVTVLDTTTTTAGEPCLVMELHDLGSVHDRLREVGPLPVSDVVAAGTAVADALAFAHAHGVLHRDVKPQNVLVLPTSYVLSDFGIARMADAGHTATLERFSYRHASPQVLDGLAPTEADDVWSLGSTLFTLLDGRAPFASSDPAEDTALSYLRRVRTGRRRPLDRDDVPAELRALLQDCLVPDREERLATAGDALRRLRRIRTEDRSWDPAAVGPAAESAVTTRRRADEPSSGADAPAGTTTDPDADHHAVDDVAWAPGAVAGERAGVADGGPQRRSDRPAGRPVDDERVAVAAPEDAETPAAVAPSVLAHVARAGPGSPPAGVEPDDGRTGLGPQEPGTASAEPRRRARDRTDVAPWRRIAAFLGGALLVGAAIGLGSALLTDDGAEGPTATGAPPTGDVPTGPAPSESATVPNIQDSDPALAPRQLAVDENRGTAIALSWTAPEQPDAVLVYVIVRTDVDPLASVQYVQPPLTSGTVEGTSPDAEECFVVVAMPVAQGEDPGVSEQVCG